MIKSLSVFRLYDNKEHDQVIQDFFFNFEYGENWILDAMYVDEARLRNRTSFELWMSMGEFSDHVGIESQFVEVFVNNETLGLYSFNEDFNNLLLDLNAESVMYRGIDNSDATYFNNYPEKEPKSALWENWEQLYPDPSNEIKWSEFREMTALITLGSDEEFKAKIGDMLDLENVIDYYLFITLIAGYDNIGKNWHFLKRSPAEKFIIVPWDLDATWGRTAFGETFTPLANNTNGLFERLQELNPEGFNENLSNRWNELRLNQFSNTNLLTLFEENFNELMNYQMIELENDKWNLGLDIIKEKILHRSLDKPAPHCSR